MASTGQAFTACQMMVLSSFLASRQDFRENSCEISWGPEESSTCSLNNIVEFCCKAEELPSCTSCTAAACLFVFDTSPGALINQYVASPKIAPMPVAMVSNTGHDALCFTAPSILARTTSFVAQNTERAGTVRATAPKPSYR